MPSTMPESLPEGDYVDAQPQPLHDLALGSVGKVVDSFLIGEAGEAVETVGSTDVMTSEEGAPNDPTERPGWLRRNRFRIAMGAGAVSLAASLVADPVGREMKPFAYVGAGMAGSDIVWAASAGVAYRAAFGGWKSLVRISEDKLAARDHESKTSRVARAIDAIGAMAIISKDELAEAAARAYDSKVFKVAYVVNTIAATAFFAIPAGVMTTELPVESWGMLTPSALEFATTITARLAINAKLRERGEK